MRQRRVIRGYMDFGGIRIPPLPQGTVFTDRDDGTLWLLSHTVTPPAADGFGYITITDVIPNAVEHQVYEAYGEPVLGTNPMVRLLIRGGYLGYEDYTLGQGITDRDNQRIMTRKGLTRVIREIIVPTTWNHHGDVLGWDPEPVEL